MKKYRIILILIIALVLSSLLYFVLALIVFDNKAPVLQSVVISNITNDKFDLTVKIKNTLFEEVSCYLTLDENLDLESEGIDFQPTKKTIVPTQHLVKIKNIIFTYKTKMVILARHIL